MTDQPGNMWDQRYATSEFIYGTEPNVFLKEQLALLPAGRILLPGDGEGRNAVHAARAGWEVHAFDASSEACKKALSLAALNNVALDYSVNSIMSSEYPRDYFDVIALIFVHLHEDIRAEHHKRLMTFLKPGGTLLLEGFSKEQLPYTSGGPKDIRMLYSSGELADDFADLKILRNEKEIVILNEGPLHQGEASVIRFIAKKQ